MMFRLCPHNHCVSFPRVESEFPYIFRRKTPEGLHTLYSLHLSSTYIPPYYLGSVNFREQSFPILGFSYILGLTFCRMGRTFRGVTDFSGLLGEVVKYWVVGSGSTDWFLLFARPLSTIRNRMCLINLLFTLNNFSTFWCSLIFLSCIWWSFKFNTKLCLIPFHRLLLRSIRLSFKKRVPEGTQFLQFKIISVSIKYN